MISGSIEENLLDFISSFKAFLLGVVEGATEFLPISSTGHLIFFGDMVGFNEGYSEVFDISIQTGALLAVLLYYRRDFVGIVTLRDRKLLKCLFLAFFPIGIFGLLFGGYILDNFFDSVFVGTSFIIGALLMFHVEFLHRQENKKINNMRNVTATIAVKIGLMQTLALMPGFSRSGAAIIGGMYFGLNRSTATNFSFLLAVPVILSATFYSIYLKFDEVKIENLYFFFIGFCASLLSAYLVIRFLISYLKTHSLLVFAFYRIIAGIVIIFFGHSV